MTQTDINFSFADIQHKEAYKLKNIELIPHLLAAAQHKNAADWKFCVYDKEAERMFESDDNGKVN